MTNSFSVWWQMGAVRVVTATSGAANIALAKSFGADVVIDYKVEDIFAALPNDSVDIVYDSEEMLLYSCCVLIDRSRVWYIIDSCLSTECGH